MNDFDAFWDIARHWRHPMPNPPKPAAIAYHRAIKEGADHDSIVSGARGYTLAMEDLNTEPQFYNTAAKFLSEWRWLQYTDYADQKDRERQEREASLADLEKRRRRQEELQLHQWREKFIKQFGREPDSEHPREKRFQELRLVKK